MIAIHRGNNLYFIRTKLFSVVGAQKICLNRQNLIYASDLIVSIKENSYKIYQILPGTSNASTFIEGEYYSFDEIINFVRNYHK